MTEGCVCTEDHFMPKVRGTRFVCECKANVFHWEHDRKLGCLVVCNGCGKEYSPYE